MPKSNEYQKKICLIGDSATGKTSLIRKYTTGLFDEKYISTIGTNITSKNIVLKLLKEDANIKLIIWDILGEPGYPRVLSTALKGVNGILLVCDITRKETLESLRTHWLPEIRKGLKNVPMLMLANKNDLKYKSLKEEDLWVFSLEYEIPFLRTSAKSGENVDRGFNALSEMLVASGVIDYDFAESPYLDRDIQTAKDAADILMYEIYTLYGDNENARNIVRDKFSDAGINLKNPTRESLLKVITIFYDMELKFAGEMLAKQQRKRREELIKKLKFVE